MKNPIGTHHHAAQIQFITDLNVHRIDIFLQTRCQIQQHQQRLQIHQDLHTMPIVCHQPAINFQWKQNKPKNMKKSTMKQRRIA